MQANQKGIEAKESASSVPAPEGFFAKLKAAIFGEPKAPERTWDLSLCDLNSEEIEELRMLSVFDEREVKILRLRFKDIAGDSEWVDKNMIAELKELRNNPLRHRVVACFESDEEGFVDFREFIITASNFSPNGPREKKLGLAFKMHDYDGDEKISKDDLRAYLKDVTAFTRSASELAQERRCQEAEEAAGAGKSVQKRLEWNQKQLSALREAAAEKKSKVDPEEKRRYEDRIKKLETAGVLNQVVDLAFEEASADREFIIREDFIRVLGHTDFQGKLVVDFCQVRAK
ncbi:Calcineurin subunit B [Hondaea fermentalgiana]|uniref:Calcineurin subunit B n=1 Tax=Hondaea fermentalgiana TaxID=2315210 RepID=A0A2R5GK49_9STRA|nr:Calcineurin subunit B [Hondaea fermentalgiana]|eukprot:GBG31286.1 Calcineurin subunit B [Hondaea fermentalgiana]